MSDSGNRNDPNQTTRPIGRYKGRTVHLAVRAAPSLDAHAPEEFAVVLFLPRADGPNIDVPRIDTADAGTHYDRLYLPEDHPLRKDYSIGIVDYRTAQRVILDRWHRHIEAYEENHGLPAVD